MKTLAISCALILFALGCASSKTHEDAFVSLHSLIEQKLGDSCDCGPITTNAEVGGRLFEVQPKPQGLLITVFERQFLTQTEWERRHAFGTNSMSQFMDDIMARTNSMSQFKDISRTNHFTNADRKAAARFIGFTNAFGLFELPGWHYQNIGVDVDVQEPDVVYPGLDQNEAAAQKCYGQIVMLLKPY